MVTEMPYSGDWAEMKSVMNRTLLKILAFVESALKAHFASGDFDKKVHQFNS